MISRLCGDLLEKLPPRVVIDVHGIAYEVDVSMTTFYQLPALGEALALYTHLVVREDAHLLFGFSAREEREAFRCLIKVTGIGARTALAVLSGMTVDELAHAIAGEDHPRLSSIPGIGKKTAERLILELRGKLFTHGGTQHLSAHSSGKASDESADIVNALLSLGYSEKEANTALKALPAGPLTVSEGIRLALKALVR